jgi:hypothetical protein
MSFHRLWNLCTYIFYKFTKVFTRDTRPEYSRVVEENENELEYGRLPDSETPTYTFVILKD